MLPTAPDNDRRLIDNISTETSGTSYARNAKEHWNLGPMFRDLSDIHHCRRSALDSVQAILFWNGDRDFRLRSFLWIARFRPSQAELACWYARKMPAHRSARRFAIEAILSERLLLSTLRTCSMELRDRNSDPAQLANQSLGTASAKLGQRCRLVLDACELKLTYQRSNLGSVFKEWPRARCARTLDSAQPSLSGSGMSD
jgi:hypothetical protein